MNKIMTIEEAANRWWELFGENESYSHYIDLYMNEAQGDIFSSADISDFKKFIRENDKEMTSLETRFPNLMDFMFPKKSDGYVD